jgi:hypothetical protein
LKDYVSIDILDLLLGGLPSFLDGMTGFLIVPGAYVNELSTFPSCLFLI